MVIMKVIEKDILTVEKGVICQQVNCQGVMGSGLAKQIREKWPVVYKSYLLFCNAHKPDFCRLGIVNKVKVSNDLFVANIFSQLFYGYDGKRYTDYGALKTAFNTLDNILPKHNNLKNLYDVYFPFNFGCDRGGADWNIVSKMIDYFFPDAIVCKLPETKQRQNEMKKFYNEAERV